MSSSEAMMNEKVEGKPRLNRGPSVCRKMIVGRNALNLDGN